MLAAPRALLTTSSLTRTPVALPATLEESLDGNLVLRHGRLQSLTADGAVRPDASASQIQPEWKAPLQRALVQWQELPALVPDLELISVYARGSIPRGLAMNGLSDVDTIGYATIGPGSPPAALDTWRKGGDARTAALLKDFPFVSGLEMKLIVAPQDAAIGRWLRGEPSTWDPSSLRHLDAFRLASQGLLLHGEDLVSRLPPPIPKPRLMLMLRTDLARATATATRLLVQGDSQNALTIGRWVGKRALRSGMELAAAEYGGFSRDLLPCHEAIAATLGDRTARASLRVLQLCCMPDEEVSRQEGAGAVAIELLHATCCLQGALEAALLQTWFCKPLESFEGMEDPPPLPTATAARPSSDTNARFLPDAILDLRSTSTRLALIAKARIRAALRGTSAKATPPLHSDPLPALTVSSLEARPHVTRVLELAWPQDGSTRDERARRVARVAQRAIAMARRPVLLRGAALARRSKAMRAQGVLIQIRARRTCQERLGASRGSSVRSMVATRYVNVSFLNHTVPL